MPYLVVDGWKDRQPYAYYPPNQDIQYLLGRFPGYEEPNLDVARSETAVIHAYTWVHSLVECWGGGQRNFLKLVTTLAVLNSMLPANLTQELPADYYLQIDASQEAINSLIGPIRIVAIDGMGVAATAFEADGIPQKYEDKYLPKMFQQLWAVMSMMNHPDPRSRRFYMNEGGGFTTDIENAGKVLAGI